VNGREGKTGAKDFIARVKKKIGMRMGEKMTGICHNEQEDPRMAYTLLIM
jgi:hypothetical protein